MNKIFDIALNVSQEERKSLIIQYTIANAYNDMIAEALQVLRTPPQKRYWPIAIDILHAIGYPQNKIAIARLVEGLCDGNNPGWEEIIETVKDIPAIAVVPYMIKILLDQNSQRKYWTDDVEGISLALIKLGDDYVQGCLPSIIYILSKEIDTENIDLEFLLRIFEACSSSRYPSAIPPLIRMKQKNTRKDLQEKARILLEKFPSHELTIYEMAIDI